MCGICGFVGHGNPKTLDRMVDSLTHRGPDDAGTWLGRGVGLGMRRLAIIDVESGQQPMFNEDGSVTPRTAQDPVPDVRPAIGATVNKYRGSAAEQGASPSAGAFGGATPQKPRGQVQLGGLSLRGRVPSFGRAKTTSTPAKPSYAPL